MTEKKKIQTNNPFTCLCVRPGPSGCTTSYPVPLTKAQRRKAAAARAALEKKEKGKDQ